MRPNVLKQRFARKAFSTGGWCSIGNSYAAEVMGNSGFDAVVVDLQHGMIFLDQAVAMLQAISATPAMPMARVSQNQFFEINKLLDAGAWGLICPMIDDVHEAKAFVDACRYPPVGSRSYGPVRGLLYGGPDYFEHANETILTFGMIETPKGMANLDAIAAVDGLDGLFVGPADLSLALGLPPVPVWREGPLADALQKILASAKRHGKATGIYCTGPEFADDMRRLGFDFAILSNDAVVLRQTLQGWNQRLRTAAAQDGVGADPDKPADTGAAGGSASRSGSTPAAGAGSSVY